MDQNSLALRNYEEFMKFPTETVSFEQFKKASRVLNQYRNYRYNPIGLNNVGN